MISKSIREGITVISGRISRNLLVGPMVASTILVDAGDTGILFDPSCGRRAARNVAEHLRSIGKQPKWKTGIVVAGHSHMDHANNFHLAERIPADEKIVFVHESGFRDGKILNRPFRFVSDMVRDARPYYSPYRGYPMPYAMIMAPFVLLDRISPAVARTLFAAVGALAWPRPRKTTVKIELLRNESLTSVESLGLPKGSFGWPAGDCAIIHTPGHSPCSVSLVCPRQRTVLISDADWIGNPVFVTGSIADAIGSLRRIEELVRSDVVDLLLPAHGMPVEGADRILDHLRSRIGRLEDLRDEALRLCEQTKETDVGRLTRILARRSALYREMKVVHYPRMVCFPEAPVARALIESGVLSAP